MGKKILVVDDEEEIREIFSGWLQDAGYAVECAVDGQSALEAYAKSLQDGPYALMLLDVMMPGIDGYEVLKSIRQSEERHGVGAKDRLPVLVVTGAQQETMPSFAEACDDYIVKPFPPEALVKKVEEKIGGGPS